MTRAFTLLELLVVVVVLGVCAALGTQILTALAQNYRATLAFDETSGALNNAVLILERRLSWRIKPTTAAWDGSFGASAPAGEHALRDLHAHVSEPTARAAGLMWFARSYETQRNDATLGWSGFLALQNATQKNGEILLPEPAGDLSASLETLQNLYNESRKTRELALIFHAASSDVGEFYRANSTTAHAVTLRHPHISLSPPAAPLALWQTYELAHTLGAVALEGGELAFYYDFLPREPSALKRATLLQNVTSFTFAPLGEGGLVFEICVRDGALGGGFGGSAGAAGERCKSAVVW